MFIWKDQMWDKDGESFCLLAQDVFQEYSKDHPEITIEQFERELENEVNAVTSNISRTKAANLSSPIETRGETLALLNKSVERLYLGVKRDIEKLHSLRHIQSEHLREALRLLNSQYCDLLSVSYQAAQTIVSECLDETKSPSLVPLCKRVGHNVIKCIAWNEIEVEHHQAVRMWKAGIHGIQHRHRTVQFFVSKLLGPRKYAEETKIHLGNIFLSAYVKYTGYAEAVTKKIGVNNHVVKVKLTDKLIDWIETYRENVGLFFNIGEIMVIPPCTWSSDKEKNPGGYVLNSMGFFPQPFLRMDKKLRAITAPSSQPLVDVANYLQSVKWRVSRDVLGVAKWVWKQGTIPGLLSEIPKFKEIPIPWDGTKEGYWALKKSDPQKLTDWKMSARMHMDTLPRVRSERLLFLMKMTVAEKYANEPKIYFSWSCDFRGRFYPQQNWITPQGDGLSKALIEFADGELLDSTGFKWLKIMSAGHFGLDKKPFSERIKWFDDNSQLMLKVAENPTASDEIKWWSSADSPWEFLACCFAYLRHTKGEPVHMPGSVDGSCNGIQHLSAMLRDYRGGYSTNLVPCDKPQDVYTEVALETERILDEDIANGVNIENAEMLKGHITRKLVKRNVMTTPYGVTLYGMKDQLWQELREDFELSKRTAYLASVIHRAISGVVSKSRELMSWLQEIARVCAKEHTPVLWKTPLGFTVWQDYREYVSKRIHLITGTRRFKVSMVTALGLDNCRKHANGIAPNFVHSMDATHMAMVCGKLRALGFDRVKFVHDSYGCNLNNMDTLTKITREEFVRLYTEFDPVQEMYEFTKRRVNNALVVPEPPTKGSLNISRVIDSDYFFA